MVDGAQKLKQKKKKKKKMACASIPAV